MRVKCDECDTEMEQFGEVSKVYTVGRGFRCPECGITITVFTTITEEIRGIQK